MTHLIRLHTPLGALALLAALGAMGAMGAMGAARAADTADAPAAHWVERNLDFTYMGFTTKYSCDGLEGDVRELLLALGARKKDLHIQSAGCSRLEGVEPFPGVRAKFWVLEPVTADEAAKGGDSVVQATQWQTVNLVGKRDFRAEQGQCELLEQLKRQALPLFTSRNLNFHSACVPYDVTLGDIRFSVDVLRVVPAPAPTA